MSSPLYSQPISFSARFEQQRATMELESIYKTRFGLERELARKNQIWQVLCKDFFQRYIRESDTVVDLAAGYCEFINNIRAKKKVAIDLNPASKAFVGPGVDFVCGSCLTPGTFKNESSDVFFISNFLEHLDSKEQVFQLLASCFGALKPGGRVLILQPNIALVGSAYWDFFDHKLPFTDQSLAEGLMSCGFQISSVVRRFLPYTTKGKMPTHPLLVSWYLRCLPLSGWLLGKQTFMAAVKPLT